MLSGLNSIWFLYLRIHIYNEFGLCSLLVSIYVSKFALLELYYPDCILVGFSIICVNAFTIHCTCRGGQGVRTPLKNHKNIGFLSNTGPDPLKNHKDTKPVLNVGPSLAHQRNANEMAFRWRVDDDPFKVIFGSSIPSTKKCYQIWTSSDKPFWIRI